MSLPLDDHIRSVLDRVRVSLSGQLEADLAASTADILRAIVDEQTQTLIEATERAASETRLEAEQQLSHVRGEFEREREELRRGAASEIAALERTLAEARDELEVARRNLQQAQSLQDALEQQLEQTRRDQETSKRDLHGAIERSSRETEQARLEAEQTRLEVHATARELERLRARLTHSIRLASAFRTLDEATSLGDILEHLAQSACQETGRTAVFLVNGEKLRGWRALGFGAGDPIVGSDFEPAEGDVVGQAVRLGVGQQHRNGDATRLPAFAAADSPRDALALPVQVGGSVIAVLYADAARADSPEDPEWLDMIDAMAKHAGRVLEAMTVRQAAALWTPRAGARRPQLEGGERSSAGME